MKEETAAESTAKLGVRNFGLIAYFFCTVIGFCYATAYYSSFGVNILNHVAPLDLLFISFSHIGKIASTPIVIILEILAVAVVLLAICFMAVLLAFSWAALMAVLLFPIPIFAGTLAAAIRLFYWLKMAILSISKKQTMSEHGGIVIAYQQAKANTQVAMEGLREFVRSALNTYLWALKIAPRVVLIVFQRCWFGIQSSANWLRTSYLYEREDSRRNSVRFTDRRWRLRSWYELRLGPKILLCGLALLLLVQAPVLTGSLDAHSILRDCTLPKEFGCYVEKSRLGHLLVPSAKADAEAVRVYAIPSGNLASLGFSTCAPVGDVKSNSAMAVRKYATPNFRHNAGADTGRGIPACLVYLGATSSTHFLADFGDNNVFERRGVYTTREVGSSFRDCLDCPEMVVIPPGVFRMGDLAGDENEKARPVRKVRIHRFAMGKYEVTVEQFSQFILKTNYRTSAETRENGCWTFDVRTSDWGWIADRNWQKLDYEQQDERPISCVSQIDARAYVDWLKDYTRLPYRLPSEAEWEYAARAGSETRYHFGDDKTRICVYGNVADQTPLFETWRFPGGVECSDDAGYPATVGSYRPNFFGLYDTLGNVSEWTADCWNESYEGAPTDGRAWRTGRCNRHPIRGGSWSSLNAHHLALRHRGGNAYRSSRTGFRVARTLTP